MWKKGSYVFKNNKLTFVPTIFQNNVDTIGCGDIFFSIYSLLNKSSILNENENSLISP